MDWTFRAFVGAAVLHIIEEYAYPGGFADWMRRLNPRFAPQITTSFAVIVNGLFLLLCVMGAVVASQSLVFSLSVASLLFLNGLTHLVGAARTRRYVPGVVTGALLYLPLSLYTFYLFARSGQLTFVVVAVSGLLGVLYQMIPIGYLGLSSVVKPSSFVTPVGIVGFVPTLFFWQWMLNGQVERATSILIVVGGMLAVFPIVWIGRMVLDAHPTIDRAAWVTLAVHYALLIVPGAAIIEAIKFGGSRPGWTIPLPSEIGWALMIVTGIAVVLTMLNLALSGLGAPFAIALSRRLAMNRLYAWTRNPMVLSFLAFLIAAGLWLRSVWFLAWVAALVTPAWVTFLKVFEERELEIRLGAPYLEYKAKTPMLWPKRPQV